MTTVSMRLPPALNASTQDQLNAASMEVFQIAAAIGVELDMHGFLHAWLSDSVRVVVAYDDEQVPVGFGIMAYGRRWFDPRFTATVLVAAGKARGKVLEFMHDVSRTLGAEVFFFEPAPGDHVQFASTGAGVNMVKLR